ncbi:unnamed protein product [Acanthoscelides obtectus]|uniref:Uncharacterized protein n=1 Tax=Acanthoscelides obtectus TaxID=200917 RepID=A0A9P0KAG7_ACAOB|nr:unnamed protein product [Acanthoscelides obtectus]CAH1968685.1 unnamed protein product [Acanthoscelides obtectus]CAH1986647.1 unnamed protein product [Acanthoscelides obtectus]CAK1641114.1 DNA transposase THAP9 [Acanthoscelides obtectus]CAK1662533.1 DNA transposase THAP9 [Acanthoscelides obtectus]
MQPSSGFLVIRKNKKNLQWVNEKMKVKLAVQTLSKSVAEALDFLNKDLAIADFKDSEATSYFCRTVNNLFDVFNSRNRIKLGFLGFIISINSLYEYRVKETKELKYLLTYKLSQDHLEIFFSCIRSKGGYSNNPTSKQFQNI